MIVTNIGSGPSLAFEEVSLSPTFSGPFQTPQMVPVKLKKLGNVIWLELDGASANAALAGVAVATASIVIPSQFRPPASTFRTLSVTSNSLLNTAPGKLEVTSTGDIKIYANLLTSVVFSILGTNGWEKTSCFWFG